MKNSQVAARLTALLTLAASALCLASCATLEESKIDEAEIHEYHGDRHQFWPYLNAGLNADDRGDWVAAKKLYLRAYRNTGMILAPLEDSPLKSMLFGASANLSEISKIEAYVQKLDELTPLPGAGFTTNDVITAAMNYQRSLAAYNWARAAGHLGDFEAAEKAFSYSLHLETIRNAEQHISSRHYELARLYHAWGKSDLAIQHYRQALETTGDNVLKSDPIGFADVLDEFSSYLQEAGQSVEANRLKQQSAEIRKNNPGQSAKFQRESYPKR